MTLKELFEQSKKKYRLELIAGEKGIHTVVKWIYLLEDLNNISFIRGGELIISTGLANTADNWLEDFFYALEGKNVSGIILNIGKYINTIPDVLIDYCNRKGIPVLTMPWEMHIADIMQDCCNNLIKEQQKEDYLSNTFANAMFDNSIDSSFIDKYESVNPHFGYGIIAVKNAADNKLIPILTQMEQKYVILTRNTTQYIILYYSMIKNLNTAIEHFLRKSLIAEDVYYGIATIGQTIDCFFAKRIEADKALRVAIATKKPCCFYNDLGLYQVVLAISDQAILDNLYTRYLQAIIEYDQKHNSNYLEILRCYIEFNSSVQLVAQRTFTHRNTINYRIAKIKELLHCDLSSMEERGCIQLAFYYYDLKVRV